MTTPTLQIAIDAADPHMLNRFWAAAMDYEIEDHHDMIGEIVGAGHASLDDTVEIDGRRAWKTAAASRPRDGGEGPARWRPAWSNRPETVGCSMQKVVWDGSRRSGESALGVVRSQGVRCCRTCP